MQRTPQPPQQSVQVTIALEKIRDTSLAAELCRRILRAQARAAAKRAAERAAASQEQRDDAT